MSIRSVSLGGSGEARATPGTPIAEAVVMKAYQDHQSRRWYLQVKLEGGRVLERVGVLSPTGSGATGGTRPRLPAKGTRGVVVWPSFARNSRRAFWMADVDEYEFGVDSDHPGAQVTVHAARAADRVDELGQRTTRLPGGDVLFLGRLSEAPKDFMVRPKNFRKDGLKKLDDTDEGKEPLQVNLDGRRLVRRVRVTLKDEQAALLLDEEHGELRLRATRGGEAVVEAKTNGTARFGASGSEGGSFLRVHGDDSRMDTGLHKVGRAGDTLDWVAMFEPTQENLELLADLLAQTMSRVARLEAQVVALAACSPCGAVATAIQAPPPAKIRLRPVKSANLKAKEGG